MQFVIPSYALYIAVAIIPATFLIRAAGKAIAKAHRESVQEGERFAEQNRRENTRRKEEYDEKEKQKKEFCVNLPLTYLQLYEECQKAEWIDGKHSIVSRFLGQWEQKLLKGVKPPQLPIKVLETLLVRIFPPIEWSNDISTAKSGSVVVKTRLKGH